MRPSLSTVTYLSSTNSRIKVPGGQGGIRILGPGPVILPNGIPQKYPIPRREVVEKEDSLA